VRDEALRAIEDPAVALANGRGLRAARVGAGAGLGEAEAAEHLAAGEQREVATLLRLVPHVEDGRGAERRVGAHRDRVRRIHLGQLVDRQDVAEQVEASAADLFRPRHAQQPQFGHLRDALPQELAVGVEAGRDRGHLFAGELADHVPHGVVRLGEEERIVHGLVRGVRGTSADGWCGDPCQR
jgi:hypothetical protein